MRRYSFQGKVINFQFLRKWNLVLLFQLIPILIYGGGHGGYSPLAIIIIPISVVLAFVESIPLYFIFKTIFKGHFLVESKWKIYKYVFSILLMINIVIVGKFVINLLEKS